MSFSGVRSSVIFELSCSWGFPLFFILRFFEFPDFVCFPDLPKHTLPHVPSLWFLWIFFFLRFLNSGIFWFPDRSMCGCLVFSIFWVSRFVGFRDFQKCWISQLLGSGISVILVCCFFRFLDSGDFLWFRCSAFEISGLLDARSIRRAELEKASGNCWLLSDPGCSGGLLKKLRWHSFPSYLGRWAAREM